MSQSSDGLAHHRPGPGALIFQRVPQLTPSITDSQQPHVSPEALHPTGQLTWTFQTGPLIATQTALQGFPHYPYLLESSFLQSHRLLNLPGCHFPSSRSPACDKELALLWHIAFHPVCSSRRSPARCGICITEQKGKNTPLLSLMCSIGKHPNSYSFSRKALPGFLAYCVRDLVFLGSTFPTEDLTETPAAPGHGNLWVLLLCSQSACKQPPAGGFCLGWGPSTGQTIRATIHQVCL